MKTLRWMKWAVLGVLLLSATAAEAVDWGTFYIHTLTGTQGSWTMRRIDGGLVNAFVVDVGAGCDSLTIETGTDGHGGYGNCSLYVRMGALPTGSTYLKRSVRVNYKERIFIRRPAAGRYFIRMYARSSYRACLRVYTTSPSDETYRFELYRMNWERDIRGIRHLALNSRLNLAAERHAKDMYVYGYYGHIGRTAATRTVLQRIAATGYQARAGGENIDRTYYYINDMLTAWMSSSTSRANILNPTLRHVGFGYWGNDNWSVFRSVAVFAQPR